MLLHSSPNYATFAKAPVSSAVHRPKPSFWSRLFLSYANEMMQVGSQRQVQQEDLLDLDDDCQTQFAYAELKHHYDRHQKSIVRAVVSTYGWTFLRCGLVSAFCTGCDLFAPVVLHHVIDEFAAFEMNMARLGMWLTPFFISRLVNALLTPHNDFQQQRTVFRMAQSLKALLFAKVMKRSLQSRTAGKAVDISNLYTSDVQRVMKCANEINTVWILPIQIGVVVYMLYSVLGIAALAGLGVIGLSMTITFFFTKISSEANQEFMKRKDERMKVVKEVFGAIQTVKLNAWEGKFEEKLLALRALELKALARFVYALSGSIFVLWASPIFVSIASFAVFTIAMDQALTATKVFTAIALFNSLQDPLREFPNIIQKCVQANISLKRMANYLSLHEIDPSNVIRDDLSIPNDVAIVVENGMFSWDNNLPPILSNVNLVVKKGAFVVVHGPVGSGKSSFCSALLGEMEKINGRVSANGKVAYYSQEPWIQNLSIRDNILFGQPFQQDKYQSVLDACGLLVDLEQFPGGDRTEIGQKGINLSGGQKARVSLARACYADADVLILDAPLAAVDAVVQSEIFSKCICGLLAEKTVVLVTHNRDVIASDAVDYIIRLLNGELSCSQRVAPHHRDGLAKPEASSREIVWTDTKDSVRLVEDEERQVGRVSGAVFRAYFKSMGGLKVLLFLVTIQLIWQLCQVASDFWLSHWINSYDGSRTEYNMVVYASLGGSSALMVLLRTVLTAAAGLRASREFFRGLTHALLCAPLRFFDANPIGRILSRFGGDMTFIEVDIPIDIGSFLQVVFATVCQLATAIYIAPVLIVFIVPLTYTYVKLAQFYLHPAREILRLVNVSSSPVLSHISQSEQGVATVRAFGPEKVNQMIAKNSSLNDESARAWISNVVVVTWFQLRMELVGCGVVFAVLSSLVYLRAFLTPGMVGIAFTYALSIDSRLARLVHVWSWLEVEMVSPERIMAYTGISPEDGQKLIAVEPDSSWPRTGAIAFEEVVFNYKDSGVPVLKGLSFSIHSNERIGIVGRTGAGKSSLTMALFRINDLVSGRICIDGVDIASIPLRKLRSKLSIIPQSPTLFKGTLQAYMDPFDEYDDLDLWNALGKVGMKVKVFNLDKQLLFELSENGENFSVGERQLLCMARALLTKSKIVVMDEATASIDHKTERLLQEMISRNFRDATVLTIAHRLGTVLDSDRILVLSNGRVVEFDTPQNLVRNSGGVFYELAQEGGYVQQLLG